MNGEPMKEKKEKEIPNEGGHANNVACTFLSIENTVRRLNVNNSKTIKSVLFHLDWIIAIASHCQACS
jgi:hypothetical protein